MFRKQSNRQFKHSSKLWFILFTLSLIFFSVVHSYASTQVSLEWDPNSEPDLAGYRVFSREEGKSYDYTNPSWEVIDTSCTIYDLDKTKTYYFVTRAFDTEGLESGDSNEVRLESTLALVNQSATTSPAPGSTLSGSAATFSWSANGASVSEWWLYVGSSSGGANIHDSGSLGSSTSTTVSGLPTNGSTVHVRLWYLTGGS